MREGRNSGALVASLVLVLACSSTQPTPSPIASGAPTSHPDQTQSPGAQTGQPTQQTGSTPSPVETATGPQPQAGGTLHVGVLTLSQPIDPTGATAFDPQGDFGSLTEVLRCCLTRTLMGYTDNAGEGLRLAPDVAADFPTVSDDGLVWTFKIREGIQYAPPYDDRFVVAGDFVRALQRLGKPCSECPFGAVGSSGYLLYDHVEGFAAYLDGTATSISGIEAPDDRTFIVHLNHPNGSLGHLMALSQISPLPPLPDDPAAPLGVATGHDDGFGPYLAATGPYMLEGSEQISVDGPVRQHVAASGLVRLDHAYLVRNPSWHQSSDPLRVAYPDRIEIQTVPDATAAAAGIDDGSIDVLLDATPPLDEVIRYRDDPALSARFHAAPADSQRDILLNLVVPPMDDVHVRRAISWLLDREALRSITEQTAGQLAAVARHAVPDSTLGDLLVHYDPYGSPGDRGDLDRAHQEMAMSAYDSNGDGVCDDPVCANVPTLSRGLEPFPTLAAEVGRQLAAIGITLSVQMSTQFFTDIADPLNPRGMMIDITYSKDYPGADSFFVPQLYRGTSPTEYWNPMGVGLTANDLRLFGIDKQSPSVDSRIEACLPQIGVAQNQCWAQFDQYVMEQLVVVLPYTSLTAARTTSARVTSFAFDRFNVLPALNRMSVAPSP